MTRVEWHIKRLGRSSVGEIIYRWADLGDRTAIVKKTSMHDDEWYWVVRPKEGDNRPTVRGWSRTMREAKQDSINAYIPQGWSAR